MARALGGARLRLQGLAVLGQCGLALSLQRPVLREISQARSQAGRSPEERGQPAKHLAWSYRFWNFLLCKTSRQASPPPFKANP